MSESIYRRSSQLLGIEDVTDLGLRARDRIEGFEGFEPGDLVMVKVHPVALTSLARFEGLRTKRLEVQGILPLSEDPFPVFSWVFGKCREIGRKGQVYSEIDFEEKGSEQSEEHCALSSIRLVKDVVMFSFASQAAIDRGASYTRELMYEVSNHPGLPLRAIDEEDGGFRLKHSEAGKLSIRMSLEPLGVNPTFFACSLPGTTTDEAVDLLARFVQSFGTSKRFDYTWGILTMPGSNEAEVSKEIYRAISASPAIFKGRRYMIQSDIHLDRLANLEELRSLCSEEDRIVTALGYYRPSDVNWVNLEIVTRADGYRLNVESRLDIDAEELGATLGVELEEGQWR